MLTGEICAAWWYFFDAELPFLTSIEFLMLLKFSICLFALLNVFYAKLKIFRHKLLVPFIILFHLYNHSKISQTITEKIGRYWGKIRPMFLLMKSLGDSLRSFYNLPGINLESFTGQYRHSPLLNQVHSFHCQHFPYILVL